MKALIVRSHPQGKAAALKVSEALDSRYTHGVLTLACAVDDHRQLFELFGDARVNHHATSGFSVLLKDREEVLTSKCHAVVRVSPCTLILKLAFT